MAAPSAVVGQVAFVPLSDATVRTLACATVETWVQFDEDGIPQSRGVQDLRMGTGDNHFVCDTCRHDKKRCPGHPGVFNLRTPVIQSALIKLVRMWLRVVCHTCGAPLAEPHGATPLRAAAKKTLAGRACGDCGAKQPKVLQDPEDRISFLVARGEADPVRLHPGEIRAILERVTDETVLAFGQTFRPEVAVLGALLVLPVSCRPGLRGYGTAGKSNHHLTTLLQHLVKLTQALPADLPARVPPEHQRTERGVVQMYHDMTYNSGTAQGKRGTMVAKADAQSLMGHMTSKEGRIRKNLTGKRVRVMCRSTISGRTDLLPYEVGCPMDFAREVQIPERVQPWNLHRMTLYLLNGTAQYPGCARVRKGDTGALHDVRMLRTDFRLSVGDTVYRNVVRGDVALFNRQPTLERSGIGAHDVVPGDHPTLRMNVLSCKFYNADFDGDQMNLVIAQTPMAQVEAHLLSHTRDAFISAKSGAPQLSLVQDGTVGAFELTREGRAMNRWRAMMVAHKSALPPAEFDGRGEWTGRDLVSALLRHAPVDYDRGTAWFNKINEPYVDYVESEKRVRIRAGVMESGVLDGKSVGGSGSIFHAISLAYGSRRAMDMLYSVQHLVRGFLELHGTTVAFGDFLLDAESRADLSRVVGGVLAEAALLTDQMLRGDLVPPIGMTVLDYFEVQMREALKTPDEVNGPIMTGIFPATNGLKLMQETGSKGKLDNVMHIMGYIGTTEINGARIPLNFSHSRAHVYAPRYSTDPTHRGLIDRSYVMGLRLENFLPSAMNSRYDLINKALSTASTGYRMRRNVLCLQTALVNYFGGVVKDRNAPQLVQALYGDDGLDTRFVERVDFPTPLLSREAMAARFAPPAAHAGDAAVAAAAARTLDRALEDQALFRLSALALEAAEAANRPQGATRYVAANPLRELQIVRAAAPADPQLPAPRDYAAMLAAVEAFCERLPYVYMNEAAAAAGAPLPERYRRGMWLQAMLVRSVLGARETLEALTPRLLAATLDAVWDRVLAALADPGLAVGILACHATGEPLTQYMLDSHHRSVGEGTSKTGLVRVEEVFAAKTTAQEVATEMVLFPAGQREALAAGAPDEAADRARAQATADALEMIAFGHLLTDRMQFLREPLPRDAADPAAAHMYPPLRAADLPHIAEAIRLRPFHPPPPDLTQMCLRYPLDKSALALKGVEMEQVVERLRAALPNVYVVHTTENAPDLWVRVYLRAPGVPAGATTMQALEALHDAAAAVVIRGVPGVRGVRVVRMTRHVEAPDGALALVPCHAVKTVGSNLAAAALHSAVDPLRAVSTSVDDTYHSLGIEAARAKLVCEIPASVKAGDSIDPRHFTVFADEMTRLGRVVGMTAAGLAHLEPNNSFLQAAMAAPGQVFSEAVSRSAVNNVDGLVGPLCTGAMPTAGTNYTDVVVNREYVAANTYTVADFLNA